MFNTQELALSIQPIISYPHQAQVGKTYLMTIDLQSSEDEWPYEEEEYPIYCMLDTSALFSCQPLGESAVVLHRFGGSYGAAEFLLTAVQEEMQGEITVTLVNGWGVPIRVLSLGKISVTQVVTDKEETIESYERGTSVPQKLERKSDIRFARNPYIIGRPIREGERSKFFGRENLLNFIQDNLSQGVKTILLHGQRRIGKTSVLIQIPNLIKSNEFIFIQFDLQDKIQSSLSNIIHDLATAITEQVGIEVDNLQIPTNAELEQDTNLFFQVFLQIIYEIIGNKKIVLLIDQFDFINNDINEINIDSQHKFFLYLKKILKDQDKLFVIAVIERYLDDLPKLLNLFKDASIQEIGLLDDINAKRMIVNPAEEILTYEQEAINKIMQLSAGHPCYTQVICSALFEQARENSKWIIECADVENIVEIAIEKADSFFQSLWHILTLEERIIMSTVAEAQKIAIYEGTKFPEEPLDLLRRNGLNRTQKLSEAWERVIGNRYLSNNGRKVKVELIRLWLLQFHPLQSEIQNFKTHESQTKLQIQNGQEDIVKNLIEAANYLCQQGQNHLALELYEQALARNHNDLNIAVSLAEQYLQAKNFEKYLELHKQLYQEDSQSSKKRYLDALSEYGHYLLMQKQYVLAKEQYNKILEIEPNLKSARQKILEIKNYENTVINNEVSSKQGWFGKAVAAFRRIFEN
ncbi:ATP-binding protein [Nostoc sp. PA-18-2419]|uniref:ATP-binding protein n=1 Tax=Nostoc sp. PA-18-2419 TaxID=2575443 RepID=UPI001109B370|nr:ATP-binding protein [Nostoc sp. PA-18-2419]